MSTTEPTDEMVEAAAEALHDAQWVRAGWHPRWREHPIHVSPHVQESRDSARAALRAALAVAPAPSEGEDEDDDEQFCVRCYAGVDSDEHHTKCVAAGLAEDGESAPARSDDDREAGEVARIKQVLDTHLPDIIIGLNYATRSSQSKSRDELTPEEAGLRAALSAAHWIAKKVEPGTLPPTESFDLPSVLDLMEQFKKLGGWDAIRALDTRRSPVCPPEDVTKLLAECSAPPVRRATGERAV